VTHVDQLEIHLCNPSCFHPRKHDLAILTLIAQGKRDPQIAAALDSRLPYVSHRVKQLRDAFAARDRTSLVFLALKSGWLNLENFTSFGDGLIGYRPNARDAQILKLVAEGYANKEIVPIVGLALPTIKNRLRKLSIIWRAAGRTCLVVIALRLGVFSLADVRVAGRDVALTMAAYRLRRTRIRAKVRATGGRASLMRAPVAHSR
jgi:DNA-binding CsgD family transcriptional regulator